MLIALLSNNYRLEQHILIVFTKNNDLIIVYMVEEGLGRRWQLLMPSYGDLQQKNLFCIQVIVHWFENKWHDFFVCLVMINYA